jgi:aryl-alcohol dehydrogenase-like predicted oxidoreductase
MENAFHQKLAESAHPVGLELTGITSQQHMKEDLQAERLTLTPEEIQRIETIAL